jgi:nitrite reductase/ring-hydroxylating ferredoxin subunit
VIFTYVCAASEIAPSTCREFAVGRRRVLVCEHRGEYYAHSALCPHQANSLDGAILWNGAIDCPWHHYTFDVVTGENQYPTRFYPEELLCGLAGTVRPLRTFPLQRRGEDLYVAFPSDRAEERAP